jgi:hypothetical protein
MKLGMLSRQMGPNGYNVLILILVRPGACSRLLPPWIPNAVKACPPAPHEMRPWLQRFSLKFLMLKSCSLEMLGKFQD